MHIREAANKKQGRGEGKDDEARPQRTAANGKKQFIAHSRDQDLHMRGFVTRPSDTATKHTRGDRHIHSDLPRGEETSGWPCKGCAAVPGTPSGGVRFL